MTSDTPPFPGKSKNMQFLMFSGLCVAGMFFLGEMMEMSKCQKVLHSTMMLQTKPDNFMTVAEFKEINERILQQEMKICDCGCFDSPDLNCKRRYSLKDVEKSAYVVKTKEISEHMELALLDSKKLARINCIRDRGMRPDGICLEHVMSKSQFEERKGGKDKK